MSEPASNEGYDRITVSMPSRTVSQLRAVVTSGTAASVSAWVAQAVQDRLAREETLRRIDELRGGAPLPEYALTWARQALGVDTRP